MPIDLSVQPGLRPMAVSLQDGALVVEGEFAPGIYKIEMATRAGLPTAPLFIPIETLRGGAYEPLDKLPSAEDVSGPWDQATDHMLVPSAEVRADGAPLGRSWADLPGLDDLPAGRYRFSTGVEFASGGPHRIEFAFPAGPPRVSPSDIERVGVAVDERSPTDETRAMRKKLRGHPQILLTPDGLERLRSLPPGPHRRVVESLCETAPQISVEDAARRGHFRTVEAVALAAALTQQREHTQHAFAHAEALMDLPYWGHCPNPQEMGCDNDIAAGVNLYALVITYDWLHDQLNEEQRRRLLATIREKARKLYLFSILQRDYWPVGFGQNHMHAATLGLGAAGLLLMDQDKEAAKWAVWVRSLYHHVLERYANDGSLPPVTAGYGMQFITRYQQALRVATGIDLFDHPQFRSLEAYTMAMSSGQGPAVQLDIHSLLSQEAREAGAYVRRVIDTRVADRPKESLAKAPMLALWYPGGPRSDEHGLPACQHFADGGIVTMRSGWFDGGPWLRLHCGPPCGHSVIRRVVRYDCAHYEPDAGSFVLRHNGQPVVTNPGASYRKLTRHHNTLTVNGVGQFFDGWVWSGLPGAGRYGVIRSFTDTPACCLVDCDLAAAYPDEAEVRSLRRCILLIKPSTFVILDDVSTRRPAAVQWWLHHPAKAEQCGEGEFRLPAADPAYRLSFVEPVDMDVRIEPTLIVRSYTNWTDAPWSLCIESAADGTAARFAAVLAPEGVVRSLDGEGDALRLELSDAVEPGGSIQAGSMEVFW